MGYALAMGTCLICKKHFSFNPVRVPSLKVDGMKEPICAACHELINKKRIEAGAPPFPEPHPDAYTACKEEELG